MTREEELDWLCRLRSEIYVYMPREWLIPMNNALNMAIKALEQEPSREFEDYENEIEDLHNRLDIAEYDKERFREEVINLEEKIKALEQEPKSGHWKAIPFGNNHGEYRPKEYVCSECGWKIDLCRGLQQDTGHRLFCEHCGAKMVEPQERSNKE